MCFIRFLWKYIAYFGIFLALKPIVNTVPKLVLEGLTPNSILADNIANWMPETGVLFGDLFAALGPGYCGLDKTTWQTTGQSRHRDVV